MTTDRKIDMDEPEAPTPLDPDALKAAQNCFGDAVSWGCEAYEAVASAIVEYLSRAALVSPAVTAPVGVKPLEWRYFASAFPTAWDAETSWGRYSVEERWGPNVEPPDWHQDVDSKWALSFGVQLVGIYASLAEAKAAAQADYEARIRSALVPIASAEPVAFQYRYRYDTKEWSSWQNERRPDADDLLANYVLIAEEKRPLYALPIASAGEAGWRTDMENAPKDGTPILITRPTEFQNEEGWHVVRWADDWWQVHDGKNDHPLRGPDPTGWLPVPPTGPKP